MKIRCLNSPDVASPPGGYSQSIELSDFNRLLFVSGQVPSTQEGKVPATFEAQAALTWENLIHQLEAADMTVKNLVKVTIFLASREYNLRNRAVRKQYLGDHAPAQSVLITGIFDESWLLEIEAIAAA